MLINFKSKALVEIIAIKTIDAIKSYLTKKGTLTKVRIDKKFEVSK
jgi:hypothetical protein